METKEVDLEILGVFGGLYFLVRYAISIETPIMDKIGAFGNIIMLLALIAFQILVLIALFTVYTNNCGNALCWYTQVSVQTMAAAVGIFAWLYLYSNTLFRKHVGTSSDCVQGPMLYFLDFIYNTSVDIVTIYITLLFCYQYATDTFSLLTTVVSITFVCEIDEKLLEAIFKKKAYKEFALSLSTDVDTKSWAIVRRMARIICWIIMAAALAGAIVWIVRTVDTSVSCECFECCGDSPACVSNNDCWDANGWQGDTGYCPSAWVFQGGSKKGGDKSLDTFCDWTYNTGGTCSKEPSLKTQCTDLQTLLNRCYLPQTTLIPWCAYDGTTFIDDDGNATKTCTCPFDAAEYCYENAGTDAEVCYTSNNLPP